MHLPCASWGSEPSVTSQNPSTYVIMGNRRWDLPQRKCPTSRGAALPHSVGEPVLPLHRSHRRNHPDHNNILRTPSRADVNFDGHQKPHLDFCPGALFSLQEPKQCRPHHDGSSQGRAELILTAVLGSQKDSGTKGSWTYHARHGSTWR